jgi:hypothetical protein
VGELVVGGAIEREPCAPPPAFVLYCSVGKGRGPQAMNDVLQAFSTGLPGAVRGRGQRQEDPIAREGMKQEWRKGPRAGKRPAPWWLFWSSVGDHKLTTSRRAKAARQTMPREYGLFAWLLLATAGGALDDEGPKANDGKSQLQNPSAAR